ncbi:hypothetical protein T07_13934 [Trichinella nelsoni]|uniref:Uncharacterized protein n=1 Tax=Trichinella nelsoni TaxID=6336 RepID=A0A0V0RUV7_9BILA|nr:hypothetical protein T07_13934 [Trichinella nelsoni]
MNALMQQQCGPQKLGGRHHCASLYARMSDAFAPVCHLVTKEVWHFASTTTTTIRIKIISSLFYARLLVQVVIDLIKQSDVVFNIDDLNASRSLHLTINSVTVDVFIRKYLITGRKLVNFEYLVSYGMKQMNSSELLGEQYP